MQLDNDMVRQLAAGMAAALAAQWQPEAGDAAPSEEPEGSETDLSDGSSSEEGDSSDSEQERHSAGGASTAAHGLSRAGGRLCYYAACCKRACSGRRHVQMPNLAIVVARRCLQQQEHVCAAEKAALHWVPQSQLPTLDDDEMLDRLEQAARSGLAAQAKQVQWRIYPCDDVMS